MRPSWYSYVHLGDDFYPFFPLDYLAAVQNADSLATKKPLPCVLLCNPPLRLCVLASNSCHSHDPGSENGPLFSNQPSPLEHIPILNLLSHSDPLGLLVDLFSVVSCANHSNSFLVIFLLLSLLISLLDLNRLDSGAQTTLLISSLEALCSLQEVLGDVVVVVEVCEVQGDVVLLVCKRGRCSLLHQKLDRLEVTAKRSPVKTSVSVFVALIKECLLLLLWSRLKVLDKFTYNLFESYQLQILRNIQNTSSDFA